MVDLALLRRHCAGSSRHAPGPRRPRTFAGGGGGTTMGRRSRRPSLVGRPRALDLRSARFAGRAPRGEVVAESCAFVVSAVAGCWHLGGWALRSAMRSNRAHPSGWRWRSWRGGSGEWSRGAAARRSGSSPATVDDWVRRGGCTACTAASTPSATARCAPRATGWRRCSPAGPARCSQPPQRRRALGPPQHRPDAHRRHRARAAATAPRGSACTALVPSMPRTPPATRASRSRRSAAPCSISPPPHGPASSSARSRRPSACGSTTTAPSQTSSPEPTGTAEHSVLARATSREPKWTQQRMGSRVPGPHPPGRPPRAPDQRRLPRPRPRPLRARLPLARNTASSSRPTAARPTAPDRRSENDRAKDAALTAAGYRVLRFTRDDEPAPRAQAPTRAARATQRRWAWPGSSCPRPP